jgi:hypothetical protein
VAGRKQWTEGMFFEDASRRCEPAVVSTMQKLFDWAKSMGKVRFGTGTVSGSYTLYQERNSKSSSVFSIYSDGTLTIHLGNMAKIFSEEEIDNFRKSLSMIPTLGEIETCTTYFYNKKMGDVFSKPEYLTQFMNCVRGLR